MLCAWFIELKSNLRSFTIFVFKFILHLEQVCHNQDAVCCFRGYTVKETWKAKGLGFRAWKVLEGFYLTQCRSRTKNLRWQLIRDWHFGCIYCDRNLQGDSTDGSGWNDLLQLITSCMLTWTFSSSIGSTTSGTKLNWIEDNIFTQKEKRNEDNMSKDKNKIKSKYKIIKMWAEQS